MGDGTTWSDVNNWNGGIEPGPGENAVFQDVDATVSFTTSPTIAILDIRANRNVTLNLNGQTLNIGAIDKSNIVKINSNSTLTIASGTLIATADLDRDAIQFRGGGGVFNIEAGTTLDVTGRKGITSKSDASSGELNNSGEINIVEVTNNDGISLNANTQFRGYDFALLEFRHLKWSRRYIRYIGCWITCLRRYYFSHKLWFHRVNRYYQH